MIITAEKGIQNATTARRSAHPTSFLWAFVQAVICPMAQDADARKSHPNC